MRNGNGGLAGYQGFSFLTGTTRSKCHASCWLAKEIKLAACAAEINGGYSHGEFAPEIKELGDKIVGLSLLQAKALGDYLKEVHGIEAAAGGAVMMAAAPGAAGGAAKAEEKSTVDVILAKVADTTKKISVIKVVREITGLGLKEAKDVVDKAPQVVKAGVPREDAAAMKDKLEKEGATIELK